MPNRFKNVRFSKVRMIVDPKYVDLHDELTKCYRDGKPFRTYGILDKETFDKLHGLLHLKRDREFHKVNIAQEIPYPVEQYNQQVHAGKTVDMDVINKKLIEDLNTEGIDIEP